MSKWTPPKGEAFGLNEAQRVEAARTSYRRWLADERSKLDALRREMHARLAAVTDPATALIVDLHKPAGGLSAHSLCDGCDYDGYDGTSPAWPCRTILALAHLHGIPTEEPR